jgi:hypothetical protein
MRATAVHDGPTSARYVCETLGDRWSCGVAFACAFGGLGAFRFLAEPKDLHFREFPLPAAVAAILPRR